MKPPSPISGDLTALGLEEMPRTASYGPSAPSGGAAAAPAKKSPLQIAAAHKLFLAICLLVGLLGGLAYVTFKTPLYTAVAVVELVGINTAFMNMDKVDQQAAQDLAASVSNVQTQVRLLSSRAILRRASQRMNLESPPVVATPQTVFTRLRNKLPLLRQDPLVSTRNAVLTSIMTLNANQVGATRLIEIKCQSSSPQIAANFVNTLASEQVAQSLAGRTAATQRTSQWLDSQLEESRAKLEQANDRLREFVQKSGMDFFPDQPTLADTKMRSLQGDLSAAQAERIAKQSRWELARGTSAESLADVINDPNLQALKAQMGTLRREIAQLTATLTPEHYRVKRVQAQLTEAEQAFEKEKSSLLTRMRSDYEEAQRKENLLQGAYGRQTGALASQADKSSRYMLLKRDVETQQATYNMLMTQSNQASLNALAPAANLRIADPANPTSIPTSPVPPRDIPVAGVLGAVLGFGIIWMIEMWRGKKSMLLFDEPGHTSSILGIPELGVIPSALIDQQRTPLRLRLSPRSFQGEGGQQLALTRKADEETQSALTSLQTNKSTLLAESFRQTLVSLLRMTPKDHCPVYVITSAYPGEGKTTLSANLASAMADIGKRVLLVDADLRRASVHSISGTRKDHPGLSDLLSGKEPIGTTDFDRYLQSTRNENLKVLTHGSTEVETPALLFFSPRAQQLVARFQSMFDCVIFDTAPALAFPDARLWGRHADGVVLVVRSGVTTREGATATCQRFLQDGIPVLGSILNDWDPSEKAKKAYAYNYYSAPLKEAKSS